MAFFYHTHGFTRGEVAPRLHDRVDVEFYQSAAKEIDNWLPDLTGAVSRRPGLVSIISTNISTTLHDAHLISFSYRQFDIIVSIHLRSKDAEDDYTLDFQIIRYNRETGSYNLDGNKLFILSNLPSESLSRIFSHAAVGPSMFITSSLLPPQRVFYDIVDGETKLEEVIFYEELFGAVSYYNKVENLPAWADMTTYKAGEVVQHDDKACICKSGHYSNKDNDEPGEGSNWEDFWYEVPDISKVLAGDEEAIFDGQIEPGDEVEFRGSTYKVDDVPFNAAIILEESVDENRDVINARLRKPISDLNETLGGYPQLCCFYKGRLFLFTTRDNPVKMWASAVQDPFTIIAASTHDDAPINYELFAEGADVFRWVYAGDNIFLGGSLGEYMIESPSEGPITAQNFGFTRISSLGGDSLNAISTDAQILFASRGATQLFAVQYDFQRAGFQSQDISMLATHLLEYSIYDIAFRPATLADRTPRLFLVNTDGSLRTVAISQDQDVLAWSRMSLPPDFLVYSICATADDVYFWMYDTENKILYLARFSHDEDKYYVMDFEKTYYPPEDKKIQVDNIHENRNLAVVSENKGFLGYYQVEEIELDLSDVEGDLGEIYAGLPFTSTLRLLPTVIDTGQGASLNRPVRVLRVLVSLNRGYQLFVNDSPLLGALPTRVGRELPEHQGVFEKRLLGWTRKDEIKVESASIYIAELLSITREVSI